MAKKETVFKSTNTVTTRTPYGVFKKIMVRTVTIRGAYADYSVDGRGGNCLATEPVIARIIADIAEINAAS